MNLFGEIELSIKLKPLNFDNRRVEQSKTEWLTPPYILRSLGKFDLDPCAPIDPPWKTANKTFTVEDDGLIQKWFGRVWMNPPYTNETWLWMKKLAEHGNGIALIFARTETKSFFPYVWEMADGIFFIKNRLTFYHVSGAKSAKNAGAPSCLIAYGKDNAEALCKLKLKGKYINLSNAKES